MMGISDCFVNVPAGVPAAQEMGKRRMAALRAKITAHAEAPPRTPAPDTHAAELAQVRAAARERESLILAAVSNAAGLGLSPRIVSDLIDNGTAPAELGDELVHLFAHNQSKESFRMKVSDAGARIVSDEREVLTSRIVDGLAARLSNTQPSAAGAEFARMPLSKLEEVAAQRRLGEVRAEAGGAGHSSSDFTHLLGAAAGKSLTRSYEIQRSPLVRLCGIDANLSTFMPVARITVEPGPALEPVNESGEVTSGSFADSKESLQLQQFARIFELSRPAFLSDDLGGFQRMIAEWGRVTSSLEASLIVSALTTRTMADGQVLFHSTHGNVAGSGAAISDTTLEEGSLAMSTAKANGHVVGVEPRYLVVPAAKRIAAAKILTTITPATSDDVNPWAGALELISSPHLDATSSTTWYLFADPTVAQVLVLGYYGGKVGPDPRHAGKLQAHGRQLPPEPRRRRGLHWHHRQLEERRAVSPREVCPGRSPKWVLEVPAVPPNSFRGLPPARARPGKA